MNDRSTAVYTIAALKEGWNPVKSGIDHQPWMNGPTLAHSIHQIDGKAVWKVECPHCLKQYYPASTVAMSKHKRLCRGWQGA